VSELQHAETYRGHRIEVDAVPAGRCWAWVYLIDDKITGHCAPRARLMSAPAALRRGVLAARARADELG
jgi:hypothetical protein